VALYRSLLNQRRVLIVLDNAATAEQVRPLLPGSPECLTLITSRDTLVDLVTMENAHLLRLRHLSNEDSRSLLTRRLGQARIAAEPRAAEQLITQCDHLPLALALVAARATAHPDFRLADLVAELTEATNP
jgi:hypothetical protein